MSSIEGLGTDPGIWSIMSTTRAMRRLRPDPIPESLVRSIIEAATWAPSGKNWQVASFLVVTDRGTVGRIADLWARLVDDYRALFGAAGVLDADDPAGVRIEGAIDYQREHFADTPVVIIVCEDARALKARTRSTTHTLATLVREVGLARTIRIARGARRLNERTAGASIFPAIENLLLAARAAGLAACLTTWHLLAEDDLKRIVGIPDGVRTWAVIPLGWPVGNFGPVRRRAVDDVIHRDRY